ncbi:MAG: hypothetical protein OXM61_12475 [Candidatus Poribacteria bacterium]|nr:hypothetical protein [Candidatus Poribacteria bacterium]
MTVVVDTNVVVVANGKSQQASATCVLTCVERLQQIMDGEVKLVLDDGRRILEEYMRNLRSSGADVGDRFLRWLLTNKDKMCDFVSITPIDGSEYEFHEFPTDPELEDFDPADRKFIAVALAHSDQPPILQAVDSEWWNYRDMLKQNGVTIDFICENDIRSILNQG